MIFRRFRVQVVLRVAAIAGTLTVALYLALTYASYAGAGLLGLVVVWQCIALVRYMEVTARDLARLLMSIRYSDFTQNFGGALRGGAFQDLGGAFKSVMEDFRAARAEKEEGYRYLETVMQHVGIGLISFRQDGTVDLINTAAKRLLRRPLLKNINDLAELSPQLVDTLQSLRYGEKALVKVVDGDDILQLSIYATGFKVREELFKLVSLQDIQGELDEMEVQAWRKLTRVLTHEIMNSVAPISSLASTAAGMLDHVEADGEDLEDVHGAVQTIARRSESLLSFVQDYRRLTRVPAPDFQIFPATELIEHVQGLLQADLDERSVHLQVSIEPPTLELTADRNMIEQVLINLVKNAMEAVQGIDHPEIGIEAFIDSRAHAVIRVTDNGHGIVEEALDKIFVPFFTTKKEGSGIGLSLSREIMRQHGGSISASSRPGERTVFRLRF
ncbi:MAG: GHKL domain-containing protein [Rhodothermales bacterium]|nr:GHKL domain-containing protein [Rhodothermales bacterium]MBO6780679.1 GHKL domain-containing protein [Rhodothermales bacterium]